MLNEILATSNLSSHDSAVKINSSIKISSHNLISIVEKASTLSERLGREFIHNKLETEQSLIDARLEKWCQIAAKGNQEKFAKRLSWDNLDTDAVRFALGSVSLVDKQALPSWTDTLKKAMELAACSSERVFYEELQQYLDSDKPLPFEEVLLPFIEVAMHKLSERAGSSYELLSDKARIQLGQSLLKKLTDLFAQSLDLEFSIARAYKSSQLVRLIGQLQGNSSREQYVKFVKGLLSDGLLAFFQEYSVLARLAAIATDLWIEASAEFLLRLASDWNEIKQIFQENQELGQVIDIKSSLSDPHNCGRSVIIIQFTSNLKLVYKPKNLGLEQAYFEFISWINEQNITLPLKTLKIINSSTHGWMEFVEALPCEDQQAVKRYYQRAGMILAIVYALKGTDCHCENLIACGEQPVLVDLETLFHHTMWMKEDQPEAISIVNQKLADSVIVTALLPGVHIADYKQLGELANSLDYCGFGGLNEQQVSAPILKWVNVNTDSMAMGKEDQELLSENNNQPFGENLDTSLSKHLEELIAGFKQMYQFFGQSKKALLAPDNPIKAFAGQKVRLVLRNTQLYASILQNSLHPKCLRDGVDRSIELDILALGFVSSKDKHPSWAMLAPEKQALEQLDIPYVSAYSDSDAIVINSNTTIEKFVENSSYNDVITRLQQLDNVNLAEQITIIQGSFYSSRTGEQLDLLSLSSTTPNLDEIALLSEEAILHQVIEIAQEIKQRAIYGSNNTVAWLGMISDFSGQRFQLRPMGHSLYNGSGGVALFLAALASVTNKGEFGDLALGTLQSLRKGLDERDPELQQALIKNMGMGGATGLASVVYTFVRIAEFLSELKLIEDAQQIASWLKVDVTAVEEEPGIIKGAAGTILSLLALYKVTQESDNLVQAIAWGNYLLDRRVTTDTGCQIWKNAEGESLTGFSQGIAGIAYALLQLSAIAKDSTFLSAAKEAIAYEQGSLPDNTQLSPLASWCHGLPGITLARLGGLNILNTEEIHQELEIIQQPSLKALDNLCCGNFADVEVLLVAAEQLSRPELLETARLQTSLVLHRTAIAGSFQLLPNLPLEVYHPGFSQGSAGIGYQLLRLLYPSKLPSVLLWQ
ncbi:type 2 lantipeptide synthetase LanM [Nostoc sp. KVJ3]|uniref:type 2 lanthipeptide synthetase LanM family protein n=1 Tax=Nostoc sp. KVJ3 TaxID=457945 RepID=UPI0022385A77|nr:type 2 lanthipeptide synthetase LanM family protein [Nostoc sp. KVJ3]MCW5315514.1 type 2 lantipeptide synthetase LanM [Nostoc sp. KVJ3]